MKKINMFIRRSLFALVGIVSFIILIKLANFGLMHAELIEYGLLGLPTDPIKEAIASKTSLLYHLPKALQFFIAFLSAGITSFVVYVFSKAYQIKKRVR